MFMQSNCQWDRQTVCTDKFCQYLPFTCCLAFRAFQNDVFAIIYHFSYSLWDLWNKHLNFSSYFCLFLFAKISGVFLFSVVFSNTDLLRKKNMFFSCNNSNKILQNIHHIYEFLRKLTGVCWGGEHIFRKYKTKMI